MIDIIIADDHELVRKGIAVMIEAESDIYTFAEASSFTELIYQLETKHFDLLILDLNLGDRNGIETVETVSKSWPDLPILVLSIAPEKQYAIHAFKAGASGYLSKSVFSSELLTAIDKVSRGKKFISESLSESLAYGLSLDKSHQDPLELLSKREFEVLSLFCSGKAYKEIAAELGLSPKTISTYRSRILEKLNLSNTAQLLKFSYDHHICNS